MRILLPSAFLLCASVAVRLSWAERVFEDDTAAQVHRALHILGSTPNAAYLERLADLEPDLNAADLVRALAVNPRFTDARIRLGLLEEKKGELSSAERSLLEAAHNDRQYLPAWTLASYYFRTQNENAFWQWARAALRLASDDPRALFRLASLMEPDAVVVLDRLQASNQVAYFYMDSLIRTRRLDAAQQVARIVLRSQEIRKDRLIDLTTRQLKAGNIAWALEIWNALNPPLDPERGPVLVQNALETRDGDGFHLSPVSNSGITADWHRAAFSFDGEEPDACPLFEQPIPAPPHSMRYRLSYEYKSSATGARWSFANRESSPLPLQQDWTSGEWTIFVGPGSSKDSLRLLRLQLFYRREPGAVPASGELDLRNLQLQIL